MGKFGGMDEVVRERKMRAEQRRLGGESRGSNRRHDGCKSHKNDRNKSKRKWRRDVEDTRSAWSQKHNRLLEDYRKFGVSGLVRVEDLPHYSSLSGSLAEQLDWTSGLEDSKRGHATPEKSCKEEGAEDVLSASPKSVLSYLN